MWTFISKYKNYSIQVLVNDEKRTVNFIPYGSDITLFKEDHGFFTTNDDDLAEAIREHSKYAGDYQLIEVGKEFTGTDEPPEVTWVDYIPYIPYLPTDECKIFRIPEDKEYIPGEFPPEELPPDGTIISQFNQLYFIDRTNPNGLNQQMLLTYDAFNALPKSNVRFFMSSVYTYAAGTTGLRMIPISCFDGFVGNELIYVQAIKFKWIGPDITGVSIAINSIWTDNVTLKERSDGFLFTPNFQGCLPYSGLDAVGGNSLIGINKPSTAFPVEIQVLIATVDLG